MRPTLLLMASGLALIAADPYAGERARMVREQIEARGIRDEIVLKVLRETPRHLFMPAESVHLAYSDRPAPIGHGATISQPYIVALMTELLGARPEHRVLEIGTGSGYQAAVLAKLAREVYSIELEPALAKSAAERLRQMSYSNVTVREGNGYSGWPERSPFDRIIVTAAPPEIPPALIKQLANGGRLVAPVGSGISQWLTVLDKDARGAIHTRTITPVIFLPMK